MQNGTESITIAQLIKNYLSKNGVSKTDDIFKYVKATKPTVSKGSVNVSLWNHRHVFEHLNYGTWDLLENSLKTRKEKLTHKLILLKEHLEQKVLDLGGNGDSRLAGVDFNAFEQKLIDNIKEQYIQ